METYVINIEVPSTPDTDILAINIPANAMKMAQVRCIENVNIQEAARSSFRVRRYSSLVTGGDAVTFEPGTLGDRVEKRDSFTAAPALDAFTGAFTVPVSGQTLAEQFTLSSLSGNGEACLDLEREPIVLRPGESLVLHLHESEAMTVAVAVEVREVDLEYGVIKDAAIVRIVGEAFTGSGSAASSSWSDSVSGSGAVTLASGYMALMTGLTANSTARRESVRRARYLTGAGHHWHAMLRVLDTGTPGNVRRWGPLSATDGYAFELSGTSLRVISRNNGVDTAVAIANWDAPFTLDTAYHRYDIMYNGNRAEFVVDGVTRHILNSSTTTARIGDHDLPTSFEVSNSGGLASDIGMHVIETAIVRHGPASGLGRYVHLDGSAQTVVCKSGAGTLHRLTISTKGNPSSTVTLYDNTAASGTVITVANTADAPGTLEYGVEFSTGLTAVATASSGDVVLIFD